MDRWHLNAIVLAHVNRVFAAATMASASTVVDTGTVVGLMGNLLWAASPYVSDNPTEEATMAFAGAMVGSLGPALAAQGEDAISAAEREFFARHDELVDQVWERLRAEGLDKSKSFAAVNARVWALLFPSLRYEQSLSELAAEITRL
jgi:hypothetical protein